MNSRIPRSPFGAWLRKQRLAAGMTQEQLAHAIGRGQDYIARWEGRNRGLPPHEDLMAILKVLGASFEEMQAGIDPDYQPRAEGTVFTRLKREVNLAGDLPEPLKDVIREAIEYAERVNERTKS